MRTKVTTRGQVSIPSRIREQLGLGPETVVEWVVEGDTLRVIPIPADPIRALRGSGRKGAVGRLLADRRRDRGRDG
jgi:AbrB family looped-hinge helix DNA binding protein